MFVLAGVASAQPASQPAPETTGAPSLINPRLRLDPPAARPGLLRFLTTDDNPPFNFAGPDGVLSGYSIDLARALCQELKVACTIQARRGDLLIDALAAGAGDALIPTPPGQLDARLAATLPFLPRTARFAVRTGIAPPLAEATPALLAGRLVGVVDGSPYATFLSRFFPAARLQAFADRGALLDALGQGAVDLAFADGADLAFWINGVAAAGCCALIPGTFLDRALFGSGLTIATRAGDADLRRALDSALARLDGRGTMTELYLRYFPVPLF